MKLWMKIEIADLFRISLEQAISEYPIIALDTKNQLNKLQMLYDQLVLISKLIKTKKYIFCYKEKNKRIF